MSKFVAWSFCCLCSIAALSDIRADIRADTRPDSHAPIGVMGDHVHKKGEWMLSFRTMTMSMQGNLQGTNSLSPEEIVQTQANGFAGMPLQPANLRVVPVKMTMQMQMLGVMYAPTDRVTLMAMTSYKEVEMDHITFMGGTGTQRLGTFTTKNSGLGDTQVAALMKLGADSGASWHGTLGLSLPTADIEEPDAILTPMNMRPTVRLPYPMQLGSGSFDLISGLTYSNHGADHRAKLGWGSQWRSVVRLEDNSENYRLGAEHQLSTWVS
ncbi:transporter, partial [bacterium]|nr:transporter [bacterium]